MKKILFFSVIITMLIAFTSCKDNDSPTLGAKVNVHVKNTLGVSKDGITVYMYEKEVTSSTTKAEAKKQIVTNSSGVAEFELNFTELKITESQTTLYFGVFYMVNDEEVTAGSTGITVKRDQEYNVDITMPI